MVTPRIDISFNLAKDDDDILNNSHASFIRKQ